MVKFVKLNETFIKIVCEKSVLLEISKQFEYTQKNYQYTPQARKGWDGVIKMISTRNGNFLSGLLKEVILKFKELGYSEFTFEGFDNAKSEYTENDVLSALDEFKLKDDSGSGIEIREHQLNAILTCLCGMRRIIESPTASGKSLIIYSIIRILIESGKKILLITPNSVLVDQLLNDFKQYEQYDDFGIENYTHKVYAGHEKTSNKQLVISTWQSCNLVSKETLESYDCVLVDECFHPDELVLTNIGYIPISKLNLNSIIINYDDIGNLKEDFIIKIHKNLTSSKSEIMYELKFDNNKIIRVTGNHKFNTINNGWVRADELTNEMEIKCLEELATS